MRKLFETIDPNNIINFQKKMASNQRYKTKTSLTNRYTHTYLDVQTFIRNTDFIR